MSSQIIQKRKRSANWDNLEKSLLRECLRDHLPILENKCTNTNTNKSKNITWQKVFKSFNEINSMPRTLVEIKQQWRTMKTDAKKRSSEYKRSLKTTGGGHKPPSPDEQTSQIIEMIPQEFEEDINKFDSDYNSIQIDQKEAEVVFVLEEKENEKQEENMNQNDGLNFTLGDTETSQMTPVNREKPLKCRESLPTSQKKRYKKDVKIQLSQTGSKERNELLVKLLQEEHFLKLKQMHESHDWAREEHELRKKKLQLEILILEKELS